MRARIKRPSENDHAAVGCDEGAKQTVIAVVAPGLYFQGMEVLVMATLEENSGTRATCPVRDTGQLAGGAPDPVRLDRRDWGR